MKYDFAAEIARARDLRLLLESLQRPLFDLPAVEPVTYYEEEECTASTQRTK